MSTYLLIDVSCLAWRAYHTTGTLTYHGVKTGVAYGVLREVEKLISWYRPAATAFCFDSKSSIRREKYPAYKGNRKAPKGQEARLRDALDEQIVALRRDILPSIGFRNLFQRKGYEADDLIAFLAERVHFTDKAVIVAADKDLYQCLTKRVRMYNPVTKKEYRLKNFRKDYHGIHPAQWGRVKAIAGCKTDNIVGVRGVGDKTAAKYVAGQSVGAKGIAINMNLSVVSRNMELTTLPLPGIPEDKYGIRSDRITRRKWKAACRELGIKSVPFPEIK